MNLGRRADFFRHHSRGIGPSSKKSVLQEEQA
jgi:hypothetical protein